MYEVGKDIADYVVYNSLNELKSLISSYCDNKELYDAKKLYIKENFKPTSWNQFYQSISDIFINYEKSIELKKNHLKTLQFVFISIEKDSLEGTINSIDKNADFVKEYIVVTAPKFINKFKTIKSKHKIIIIDETTILGKYAKDFSKRDHQGKNWLLRASLLNLDILEDEFIMLDDDNRILKKITIDTFIAEDGSYNAYYFYHLLQWYYTNSEYDVGQHNMKKVLAEKNYELLSYSSHSPQIINKKIFKESVSKFFDIGLTSPIDEWSTYFNYGVSLYPCLFNKQVFQTLSWPATPSDWETIFLPKKYTFENYYKSLYDTNFFTQNDSYAQKIQKKQKQLLPYIKTKQHFSYTKDILAKNNLVHETLLFKKDDIKLYLSNIPYLFVVEQASDLKIPLNYKLLNPNQKELSVAIVLFLDGGYRSLRDIKLKPNRYQESVVEIPINSYGLEEGIYDITFNIMLNNEYIYKTLSPYSAKLLVTKDKSIATLLGNPQLLETPDEIQNETTNLKDTIKSIPVVGWIIRWLYNLLRLNNLKYRVHKQQQTIIELQNITEELRAENLKLREDTLSAIATLTNQFDEKYQKQSLDFLNTKAIIENKIETKLSNIDKTIKTDIAKQISFQSDSFQQRLDQFIFDTKINLNIKESKDD